MLKIKAHAEILSDDSWKKEGFMGDLSPIFAVSFKHDYLPKKNKPKPRVWHCGREAFDWALGLNS